MAPSGRIRLALRPFDLPCNPEIEPWKATLPRSRLLGKSHHEGNDKRASRQLAVADEKPTCRYLWPTAASNFWPRSVNVEFRLRRNKPSSDLATSRNYLLGGNRPWM